MIKRKTGIDYLKCICMVFIVITHFYWTDDQRHNLLFPFYIDLAVPILMLVTGYNYYNSMQRGYSLGKLKSNLVRILRPFVYIMLLQFVPLYLSYGADLKAAVIMMLQGGIWTGIILHGYYGSGHYSVSAYLSYSETK